MNASAPKSSKDTTGKDAVRERIVAGLNLCIVEKGYSQTKLIDVAEASDTSTSLIRYYFKNKESILEHQYQDLVSQFSKALARLHRDTAGAWFRALAEHIFDERPRAREDLLVIMEANLVMARSPQMLALKRRYDQQVLDAMVAHLSPADAGKKQVQPASEVARALFDQLTGLMINVALEPSAFRAEATERFCAVAQALTGLPATDFESTHQ